MAATTQVQVVIDAKDNASKVLKGVGSSAKNVGKDFQSYKADLVAAGIAITAFQIALFKTIGATVAVASSFEQNRIAFETFYASAEVAKDILEDLTNFAKKTPFDLPGVITSAKKLAAYGVEAEDLIDTMKILGDISAGVGTDKLGQLTLAFGQVKAQGKLAGQELRQFTETGVPMITMLADHFGVAESAIKDMVSAGEVGFDDVRAVLEKATLEGGTFFNLMDKQSKSLGGVTENLTDSMTVLATEIAGVNSAGEIREGSLFDFLKTNGEKLLGILDKLSPKLLGLAKAIEGNKIALGAIGGAFTGLLIAPLIILGVIMGTTLGIVVAIIAIFAWLGTVIVRLGDIFGVLKAVWLEDVLPALQTLGDAFVTFVTNAVTWFQELPGRISEFFRVLFQEQIPAIFDAFSLWMSTAIMTLVNNIVLWFQMLPERIMAFLNLLFLEQIPFIIGFFIGWISVVIPELILMIVTWFQELPDKIMAFFNSLFMEQIPATVNSGSNWLIAKVNQLVTSVIKWFSELPPKITAFFEEVKRVIIEKLTATWAWVSGEVSTWVGKFMGFIQDLPGKVRDLLQSLKQAFQSKLSEAWNIIVGFKDKIVGAFNAIRDAINGAIDALKRGIDAGIASAKGMFSKQTGGIVPGPIGQPVPITAHAGERVTSAGLGGSSGGGSSLVLNVSVGLYAGSETEKRNIAEELYQSLLTVANARNETVAQMMGG